jgi:ATP-dependent Lhr-like helicase
LDGWESPLAAWEPELLSARVTGYDPQWLDRLSFSGRIGWGRLTAPQGPNVRAFAALRTSPIALYQREHVETWLKLAKAGSDVELSPATRSVWEVLTGSGALFFLELVRKAHLLPAQVEQALAELAALGCVTCDSFDGLRALLVPSDRRPTLGRNDGKRRRQAQLANIEFAGRWSLLRAASANGTSRTHENRLAPLSDVGAKDRDEEDGARAVAVERFARILLKRYGVVFRRLLEREAAETSWYELGRVYRRWEARGEIRGGHFVGGMSGEQFATPEAVGLLRSIRKAPRKGELVTLSAADPLNLLGLLTPGPRVPALAANRIVFRDGQPIASLEAGEIRRVADGLVPDVSVEKALKIGRLPVTLRPYYG